MVRPGMLRRRGAQAAAVLALGAAVVLAIAAVVSARAAPQAHPAAPPAGPLRASRAPAGPVDVSLAASHVSPAATPVSMAVHGTLAAGTGAASLKEGGAYLWSTATGKVTAILPDPAPSAGIGPVAFSPDGTTLAEGGANGTISLWDITAGKVTATLATPASASALAFSPDGKDLAEDTGGRLGPAYVWDIAARKITATFTDVNNPYGLTSVAFAPDGTTVAIGEATGAIVLWDTRTGKVTAGPSDPESESGTWVGAIAFGPGGTMAAGYNGGKTYLWDAAGTLTATFTDPAVHRGGFTVYGLVLALWFSPGGTTLTIGDGAGRTYLWRITR